MIKNVFAKMYYKKTNDTSIFRIDTAKAIIRSDDTKGFLVVHLRDNTLFISMVCGDGRYWQEEWRKIAKKHNCDTLQAMCVRHIIPMLKRIGCTDYPTNKEALTLPFVCRSNVGNIFKVRPIQYKGSYIYELIEQLNTPYERRDNIG